MKTINLIIVWICSVFVLLSCTKEEYYDFQGDSQNRVYFKTTNHTIDGFDKLEIKILKTISGLFIEPLNLPVYSTKPANGDITVSLLPASDLVSSYNKLHGKNYKEFPAESVNFSDVSILSNSIQSNDKFQLEINSEVLDNIEPGEYLLPLRISRVVGDAYVSSNRDKVYVVITLSVDEDNIWNEAPEDKGELYMGERSKWYVDCFNSSFNNDKIAFLFDNNESTYVDYKLDIVDGQDSGFIIDMQKNISNISGIYEVFDWKFDAIQKSEIYTSDDKNEWIYQGRFENYEESCSIIFYSPVEARYIKIVVKDTSRDNFDINEFNIYTKRNL